MYDTLPNKNQQTKFIREHGVKGVYSLMRLPYHKFNEHIQPDGMHTVTDVVPQIIDWLSGKKNQQQLQNSENELQIKR